MKRAIRQALEALAIHPVLVDVGASGAPPSIWEPLGSQSIYVGFDPDRRELRDAPGQRFFQALLVNQAVTHLSDCDEVRVYLTRSPFCSSTLPPDLPALSAYLFHDLFVVEREQAIRATTLEASLERLGLPGIDWLKLDTQGTDLRLVYSLRPETRARLLAVDIEPGLIDAYQGEDLFAEAHARLTRDGFWLSRLDVEGAVRMRPATLREVGRAAPWIDQELVETAVRRSPGWGEARYLRTLEALSAGATQRDYVLLWAFALVDGQVGFALDVAAEYARIFGADAVARQLQAPPVAWLARSRPRRWLTPLKRLIPQPLRRTLRTLLGRGG